MSKLLQFVCVLAGECPSKCHRVKSLNSNRNALKRKAISRISPVVARSFCPSSEKKDRPSQLMGPRVSRASGVKRLVEDNSLYFSILRVDALSAAAPAVREVSGKQEAARVSVTVASHTRFFPPRRGMRVWPSGLLPSIVKRPVGSLVDG